ncbi:MAG: fdhA6 [Dehalococcoidia bacterium]|nr:fdhA6 [Dehalococcoidia bacterium]
MSNSIAELEDAPLILAAGTNTTESHPVISLRVKKAVSKGAKLIVVDPRKIELTDFATRWLRLKVGTDIPLYNAMAHVIIEEGLYNKEYVAARTAGLEEMREFLKEYTPEYAEEITGVPAEEIVAAAREYAAARPASIIYTLGITEHSCGVHNVQSLANLALLCGNFGVENGGVNPLRGQNNVQGAGDVGCLPNLLPGYQRVGDDKARQRWEREWGVELNPRPGITKVAAIDEVLKGKLRAMYIMGENTVVSDANANKARRALEAVEFLVVQDLFLTETALLADVVLPAAAFAEVDGTFTNTERRVQRVRKAVEPPGQAKADWLILSELATRMGYVQSYDHPSQIWDELARNTPILAGISYGRLGQEGLQWPCPTPDHPGTRYLHKDVFPSEKGYLQMVPHVPLAEPPDDEYPLVLTTGRRRPNYHTNTQTGRARGFDTLSPHEWVEVSPHDALEMGLSDGEEVRVVSRRGRVQAPIKITDRSPAGVVFMSFHFPQTTLTNALTTDLHDPITETPEFKACAVRVEKLR